MTSSLVELRHELHAHPELAHEEHGTAARVVAFLEALSPDQLLTGIGGTGVVATFDSGVEGPVLLFRCELDALPIVELDVEGHASTVTGVSHKCGHDGHIAIVCGLAQQLAAQRPAHGKVHLLFQPAEETGTGAVAVLADPRFDDIRPDFGFAAHNMPGFPLHAVVVKPGNITAAVRSVVYRFNGRTSHASEPENGENPTLAIADFLQATDDLNQADIRSAGFQLITPVHVRIGSIAYGVSAGDGEVHLTIRTEHNDGLAELQSNIDSMGRALAQRDGLRFESEVVEDFYANVNDPIGTEMAVRAARSCEFEVVTPDSPLRGGEDFGLFGTRFRCCVVLLGAGIDHHPIHNPHYDFPDDLINTGVRLFEQIVRNTLG